MTSNIQERSKQQKDYGDRKLVKVERTRIEIRDDVAIRLYTEMVLDAAGEGEFPDADRLRLIAGDALDAAYVFYLERFSDRRIQQGKLDT